MIDPLRYPAGGHQPRTTWSRSAGSRRGSTTSGCRAAPTRNTHLKLGRGGLADIEWTVQLLQMRHAGEHPGAAHPADPRRARRGGEAGLLAEQDADWLAHGWRTVSRVRNAVTLVRGKPGDQLPRDTREKAAVASVMGYPPGASDEMVNDYLRHTRRARAVVDRVFWG